MRYFPLMILKPQIYLTAYNRLERAGNLTPIFEVFDLANINRLANKDIDLQEEILLNILDKENGNDLEYLYAQYSDIKKILTRTMITPIIDDSMDFSSKKKTFNYFKKMLKEFKKLAIKVNGIENMLLPDNLESMLFFAEKKDKIAIILDMEKTHQKTMDQIVDTVSNAIEYFKKEIDEEINNFIICGSLIEVSSANHIAVEENDNQCHMIENNLLKAVRKLKEKYSKSKIYYGDYTIDEKHKFKSSVEVRSFYPSIKFTTRSGDICIYKSNKIKAFDKYPELCRLIIQRKDFDENHCYGCQEIASCASGRSTGSPSSWKTNMMIHHMTRIQEILSNRQD